MNNAASAASASDIAPLIAGVEGDTSDIDEETLLRHITLLQEAHRIAHLGIWSWDLETNEVAWSPELFRILGRDPATFTPSYDAILPSFHEDDVEMVTLLLEQARWTATPLSYVARIRRPDGQYRWIESDAVPTVVDGKVVELLGTAIDVTERKGAEMALRESEQRFRALVQQSSDLILVLSATGRITYISPAAERLLGCSSPEVLGRDSATLVHPDDLRLIIEAIAAVPGPAATAQATFRVRSADGTWRRVETVFTNLLHEPAVRGIVANSHDVTEATNAEQLLIASEERYRLIVETAEEGIWALDEAGSTTFANHRMAAILGCHIEALEGTSFLDFVTEKDRELVAAIVSGLRAGHSQQLDLRLVREDGGEVWVLLSGSAILDAAGLYSGALLMATDITDRKVAEDQLLRSQRQLNAAQRLSRTGSWDRDLRRGTARWSEEFVRLMGAPPSDAEHSLGLIVSICHPEDRENMARIREAARRGGRHRGEFRLVRPDGDVRVMRIAVEGELDPDGVPARITGTVQDITEQRSLEEQLKRQALEDALTRLPNRTLFVDRLDHALLRRGGTGEGLSLLFIDLDDFKTVNDSLGHGAGDEILLGVARRLRATLRPSDTAARFGGDEFAVLLEGTTESRAAVAAERLLGVLQKPFQIQGREVVVRASVGIAVAGEGVDAEQLLRNADAAMYAAKRQSASPRYRMFQPSMHTAARRRLDLRAELEKAVERGEFEVYYQPLVTLAERDVVGVEALVRWNHPVQGLISPAEFVPLAEESGLIVAIGENVLRQATSWVGALNRRRPQYPLYVSVNLSPRQLADPTFADTVDDALARAGLGPEHLVLEVTESVLVEEGGTVVPALVRLRTPGIKVAIDDFGTGYSSLGYLRRLPVDILKIDRAFVTDVARTPEDAAVAHAVVSLARVLGLATVAEGIETPEQAQALEAIGCRVGQGYLFSRPIPGPQLERQLVGTRLLPPVVDLTPVA
jgi:diguanylate cyclase (GGDEF)-like protein/PAS domain S-box-containing protein